MSSSRTKAETPDQRAFTVPPIGMDAESLSTDFRRYFCCTLGQNHADAPQQYRYAALALAVRDRLMTRWNATRSAYLQQNSRRAFYLSMEYLMGRTMGNAMLNLDLAESARQMLVEMGMNLEELMEFEGDAGLGNGGLGRLAACFLDSCATLQLPVMGYGLRYEYGMFRQRIDHGYQVEEADAWLRAGRPWELKRAEYVQRVHFGGHTDYYRDEHGETRVRWVDTHDVQAVPYDVAIPGYRNGTVNTLRLWSATATEEFDLGEFNAGDYAGSVAAKNIAENITMVLYPNDASENGKALRLKQQYFLASASLKDVLRQWLGHQQGFEHFADKHVFQLNDTHPTIAVAELMRLLMDEHHLGWDAAWAITSRCMAYTNHTLLPEALERWPVRLFQELLPRLLEIIYEINARFLREVARRWPGDNERLRRMSLIEEGHEPMVRMAYLAIVGSFSVNGVAALHSELLMQGLFNDFYQLWPQKFNNKTNGVTQRRWLAWCNPGLNGLISHTIGDTWVTDLTALKQLEAHADDVAFQAEWHQVKQANKVRLAALVERSCGVRFNPTAMFDVQVKRIHEYKRQLLNILHVIHLYNRIKRGDTANWTDRCVLFGGKAAPGYYMAKQIIKLINSVADIVNNDPDVGDRLKVAFIPNYRVSTMEVICPGTDLSEQISTAGKEASGTGNMKFMMNGAVTIGTLDGANIEIRDEVGDENFFLFGLTEKAVQATRGSYDPGAIIHNDPDLAAVIHLIRSGFFNAYEPGIFDAIIHAVCSPSDPWLTAADFRSYVDTQQQAALAYQDRGRWVRMSIINVANSGRFSTDRTMREYNQDIWQLTPVAP